MLKLQTHILVSINRRSFEQFLKFICRLFAKSYLDHSDKIIVQFPRIVVKRSVSLEIVFNG